MGNIRILYFYTRDATFIRKDIAILQESFQVLECPFPDQEKWKTPFMFYRQLLFLLRFGLTRRRAVLVCQFAGYHSLIPVLWAKVMGKPSVVVVGGTDCVSFPELRYGHFQNPLLSWFTRQTYRFCTTVSAVHRSLFWRDNPYAGEADRKQGILHFFPEALFSQNEIPNGFETNRFRNVVPFSKRPELSFITISVSLDNPIRMKLKGVDLVLELARRLPEGRFTLVGAHRPDGLEIPSNVQVLPYVPNSELIGLYNQNRFYLQLSISEGFPNALCEAMASGCIPVVSKVASMPEIVGETGLVLEKRDPELLEKKVNELLLQSGLEQFSENAARTIRERFPIERRKKELTALIRDLAS